MHQFHKGANMSLFNRLFGITEANRGEVFTKVSDETWVTSKGEVIQKVSDDVSISSKGTVYTQISDCTVVGSDGSVFNAIGGSMSSDGSFRVVDIASGRGAIFTSDEKDW